MKVIAINDAPTATDKYFMLRNHINGVYLDRAYYKGDIFTVMEDGFNKMGGGRILIWHNKLEAEMDVDANNFLTLEEYREKQLDKIL